MIWGKGVWSPEGIKVLGSPIRSEAFVQAFTERRLESEQRMWNAIPSIPDFQCAWQLLCWPTLQPLVANCSSFAAGHDAGMQQTMVALLGTLPGDHEQTTMAYNLASLPIRLGVLGLRSATRLTPAACWASWGDAMPMLQERVSVATAIITRELAGILQDCLGELHTACGIFDREGFVGKPTWEELLAGARPLPPGAADPGEWQHGWQYYASSKSEQFLGERSTCPVTCQRSGPLAIPLKTRSWSSVPRSSDWARIPGAAAQSRVSTVWQVEVASGAHGDHFGPGLP